MSQKLIITDLQGNERVQVSREGASPHFNFATTMPDGKIQWSHITLDTYRPKDSFDDLVIPTMSTEDIDFVIFATIEFLEKTDAMKWVNRTMKLQDGQCLVRELKSERMEHIKYTMWDEYFGDK